VCGLLVQGFRHFLTFFCTLYRDPWVNTDNGVICVLSVSCVTACLLVNAVNKEVAAR
jgi:hypothetical protein